jgi:hypothetical protein
MDDATPLADMADEQPHKFNITEIVLSAVIISVIIIANGVLIFYLVRIGIWLLNHHTP